MELIVEGAEFVTMAPASDRRGQGRREHAGARWPGRRDRPGRCRARRGRAWRRRAAAGRCHGGTRPDRRPLPRDQHRLPRRGRRLQPAGGAGHRGDPGPAARGRGRDAGGVMGDGQRVRRVQARRAAAPDPGGPGRGRAGPPGGALPHVAARVRAQLGGAAGGRVHRRPAGPARWHVRPRRPGTAHRRAVRRADVPGARGQAPLRPREHGRGRAGPDRTARRAAAGGPGHHRGLRRGPAVPDLRRVRRGRRRRRPEPAHLRADRARRGGRAGQVGPERPPVRAAGGAAP